MLEIEYKCRISLNKLIECRKYKHYCCIYFTKSFWTRPSVNFEKKIILGEIFLRELLRHSIIFLRLITQTVKLSFTHHEWKWVRSRWIHSHVVFYQRVNAVLKVRSVYLQWGQTRPWCFLKSTCGTYGMTSACTCVWVWRRTREERDIRFSAMAHIRVLLQASVCTQAIREQIPSWFNH